MPVLIPDSLDAAVDDFARHPHALALAGGTDLMVEVNERHRRLRDADQVIVALNRVPELRAYSIETADVSAARFVTLGAGVRWSQIERDPLASAVPALAQAARTVGSPQIRAAGTIGGNLGTSSPAGDGLPVLAATEAVIRIRSSEEVREVPFAEFMVGVKRNCLVPGELIEAVTVPVVEGFQGYSKIGVRNAMVIASASACLVVDEPTRSVRIALGSVAPTIVRATDAERLVNESADWDAKTLDAATAAQAGQLAADASSPITDHRSTADYRRHAVATMTTRLLRRAFPVSQTGAGR